MPPALETYHLSPRAGLLPASWAEIPDPGKLTKRDKAIKINWDSFKTAVLK
jgi:hypothetical protein